MSRRGRKPKPENLKILHGSRADRLNPLAPTSLAGRPEPPDHLDADARAEWDRQVELLERRKTLSPTDGAALALFCVAHSRWLAARREIEARGLIIESLTGAIKVNPAVTIAAVAEAQMARLLAEFGCTPSSQGRLKVGSEAQPEGDLDAFLAKRKAR